jgi:hypothetical protein
VVKVQQKVMVTVMEVDLVRKQKPVKAVNQPFNNAFAALEQLSGKKSR